MKITISTPWAIIIAGRTDRRGKRLGDHVHQSLGAP
jgi:hypothetical protein